MFYSSTGEYEQILISSNHLCTNTPDSQHTLEDLPPHTDPARSYNHAHVMFSTKNQVSPDLIQTRHDALADSPCPCKIRALKKI